MTTRTVWVGAHVSAAGGVANAPGNARRIGATAFSLFTRNQRQWHARPYEEGTVSEFLSAMSEAGYTGAQVVPHASYLANLGSTDETIRTKSVNALADELERTEMLGLAGLNFHPGTSKGELSEAETLRRIASGADEVLERVGSGTLILENTAGQGNAMGARLSHLRSIIDASRYPDRLGVCVDTCHAFAAGYDIRTAEGWNALVEELVATVGLEKLMAIHLNDSTGELGSNRDRHKPIGAGLIGEQGFRAIMQDERLDGIPMILETPDTDRWETEISMLRQWAGSGRTPSV